MVDDLKHEEQQRECRRGAERGAHAGAAPHRLALGAAHEFRPRCRALEGERGGVGRRQHQRLVLGDGRVLGEEIGIEARVGELDPISRADLSGRLRRALGAPARTEEMGIDRVGEQLAQARGRGLVLARLVVDVALDGSARVVGRRRRRIRRRARRGRGFPARIDVAAEVEQALEGVEDGVALAAADPALGDLELILDDPERRPAGGAARGQAHREIMPRDSSARPRS